MRILLATSPMTQVNTPYPAVPQLLGFLHQQGYEANQMDLSLELFLRIFSREGLERCIRAVGKDFLPDPERSLRTVDAAVRFLQGRAPELAYRIAKRDFLPEGPRFAGLDSEHPADSRLLWAFGALGLQDQAKHVATLFIDDLADAIREKIDPRFELVRYGESLAASQADFGVLLQALDDPPTVVASLLDELVQEMLDSFRPDVVCLSIPFSGCVYGAFRIAREIKRLRPEIRVAAGGGFVNTELRALSDARVFDFFDAIALDDGELPLQHLLEFWGGAKKHSPLLRTWVREGQSVVFKTQTPSATPKGASVAPSFLGIDFKRYVSFFEMLNPMHRIWSDGKWIKLAMAHGCYWRKCSFCDTSLDYIAHYEPLSAKSLVDRVQQLMLETGQRGFHFVDEAAPPALLKAFSEEILARGLVISWWGNIRFEKAFTPPLARLMAAAGCIGLTGGLEVASDRLLKLMNKGVSVDQVARVTRDLTGAGILVHAYLMYGFPSESVQETVDSLDRVRQLFAQGCIQSAFWHRFSATVHSPIGKDPKRFGIQMIPAQQVGAPLFAQNDLVFRDPKGCSPEELDMLGRGLAKATHNYMEGAGWDLDVRRWFDQKVPKSKAKKIVLTHRA